MSGPQVIIRSMPASIAHTTDAYHCKHIWHLDEMEMNLLMTKKAHYFPSRSQLSIIPKHLSCKKLTFLHPTDRIVKSFIERGYHYGQASYL